MKMSLKQPSMNTKGVDLIVPVYKNAEMTRECIESLFNHLAEIADWSPQVIAVNDSPDEDDVGEMLQALARTHANLKVSTNPINIGFVRSVNRGMAASIRTGRDVILVNSDTLTYPGTLAELVRVGEADPMIGFVCPRSNNASLCSLPHAFGGKLPTPDQAHARWKRLSATMPQFHFTPTGVGFYLLIKNKVLANFGGLREEFGVGYEEENDLIIRANKAGYRSVIANHAFAYHFGSASFSLSDLDLSTHQNSNLQKMCQWNPEFLPLIRRYQASPHYRAENLLAPLIPDSRGRHSMIFDLSSLDCNFNGTNELAFGIIRSICRRHAERFDISISCSHAAFKFHELDEVPGLNRVDPHSPGQHCIAIRLGQPFDQHHINVLESLGPINVYGMLDTIAEDCGHLSITQGLDEMWRYVASHANGMFFISEFSRQSFCARFDVPDQARRAYTRLLPTRLSSYTANATSTAVEHILVLGNHFAHKSSDYVAGMLSRAFPTIQIVVLGAETFTRPNLRGYRSGTLDAEELRPLFEKASVVVLPSHVEGFGFGLLHALAAGKPVVARNIEATAEILATYQRCSGVHLFDNDLALVQTVRAAMRDERSSVDDSQAQGWDDWCDGFADFCSELISRNDLFTTLTARIRAGDHLRIMASWIKSNCASIPPAVLTGPVSMPVVQELKDERIKAATHVDALLALEGKDFVDHAYMTFLGRNPDFDGAIHFLEKLQAGVPKAQILHELRHSPEGSAKAVDLPGFQSDETNAAERATVAQE